MECKHERIRCTDGVFYCLLCGVRIDYPPKVEASTGPEEKPAETVKKAVKRNKKGE